ncbi:MAG: TRAP transporter large permease subunit, partial [Rhodobacteraceae bacterium]|nr:TRAP transporter large permease subunit [Paracoccaceae bacterium]
MTHEILLVLLGVFLFGGILSGAPVSFVLIGAPTLIAFLGAATGGFDLAFIDAFPSRAFGLLTNPILLSVPLFVVMGGLLEKSDIAKRMMLTAGALFGEARGGLAYAVIIVGALLAASTGVIAATIFMLGMIALPAMLEANYSPRLATGVICSAGSLGQIIPPSILLILLADQISAAYQAGRRAAGDFAPD